MKKSLFLSIAILLLLSVKGWGAEVKKGFIPEWSKKVVWYQVFPERFRNGDPSNDPTIAQVKGAYPHDGVSPWQVHPWGADWYELLPYEKKNGKDIWYNLQRRRYGGDLQGVLDKLDYLQDLGITAIYLNPVFESPSLHKYDAIRYEHIDPNFGPDPEGDRKLIAKESSADPSSWQWTSADKLALKLIKECHKRGIKVIFDGVFNHIGMRNPLFEDVVKNQEKSIYKDWFMVKSCDNAKTGEKFDYKCWFGYRELPEWNRTERFGLAEKPKNYIFNLTRRWMDPDGNGNVEDGIDGWRLDVAYCVPHSFWKQWCKHVKSINPDAYMTAEIMDTPQENEPYLRGDEFTAVMNYNFAFALTEFFVGKNGRKITSSEFDKELKNLREAFAPEFTYGMQNLMDSHDTARTTTHIVNHDKIDYRCWRDYSAFVQTSNGKVDVRKPDAAGYETLKLIALFQMTYPGSPMIYYGTEVGMWGANDPCCRKPMLWDDIAYADEVYLPDGTKRQKGDEVVPDKELFAWYKKLIALRTSSEVLQLGDYKPVIIDDKFSVYGFSRNYKGNSAVVIVNNGELDSSVGFSVSKDEIAVDKLDGDKRIREEDGKISFILPKKSGKIFFMEKPSYKK